MNADEAFEKTTEEMLNKLWEMNPDFATEVGLHEPYDYLLPVGTSERYLKNLQLLDETLKRMGATLKRQELNNQHRIEWEIIEDAYEQWRFAFYEQRFHELNPDAFCELGGIIFLMFTRNYASLEKRVAAIAARLEKTPKYLEEFRSRFRNTKPVRLWTETAIETAQSMGGLFQFVLFAAKGQVSDKVYERLSKASENLQPALAHHMEWLQGLLPNTKDDWSLGKDKFEKLLRLRKLEMTSDEILQLGVRYLNDLKDERKRLAQQIAPEKSVEEVLRMMENKAPKTFEEALEFTRRTMEEAKAFVQEKNIATVYSEDQLLVEEIPHFLNLSYRLLP